MFVSFASLAFLRTQAFAATSQPIAASSVSGVADPTVVESFGDAPAVAPNALVGATAIAANAQTGYVVASVAGQTEPGTPDNLRDKVHTTDPFLPAPARTIGIASTPGGRGNWLATADGGVFAFGDAGFFGSAGGMHLVAPVVGIAATPDGGGYWLVASDGGVFSFGDAGFFGSMGGLHLNRPVVGMAATPDGGGYWLVASDGGVFSFGDARFFGSTGGVRLDQPVVGMASTRDGGGYWLAAADGGVFTFGDAAFHGSSGGTGKTDVVGIAATADGGGYWLLASDPDITADANQLFAAGAIPYSAESITLPDGQSFAVLSDTCYDFSCFGDEFFVGTRWAATSWPPNPLPPHLPAVAPVGDFGVPPAFTPGPGVNQLSVGFATRIPPPQPCCTPGPTDTYVYTWTGTSVVSSGSPPSPPYNFAL